MKCKEIQEKEKILNKKKVQKLKEKGITLIALVVTIIILLILAGVTLNMAMSGDGLFSKARDAADKYKKAQENEEKILEEVVDDMENINIDYNDYVGAYVEGYEPTSGTCTIKGTQSGKNEDKTFSTTGETKGIEWRIWDYDGTTIRLISDKPTEQTLTLTGTNGYNNGVWIVNEICRQCFGQYENGEMKQGINVANLRRSDIQKISTYDYTKFARVNGDWEDKENGDIKYGSSKPYSNSKNPKIWVNYDKKWEYENKDGVGSGEDKEGLIFEEEGTNDESIDGLGESEDITTIKQSVYSHRYIKEDFKNMKYYDIIFNGKDYEDDFWLSTRGCNVQDTFCDFGLNYIAIHSGNETYVVLESITNTTGGLGLRETQTKKLRPIVSINLKSSGYSLKKIRGSDGKVGFKLQQSGS